MRYHSFLSAILAIICCGLLLSCSSSEESIKIGILQTASHPALDQARESFKNTIEQCLGAQVRFVIYNAEGSIAQARTMAQALHVNSEIRAIFAIGTPAAQSATLVEKSKPIVFAAVTDPKAAGLEEPGSNAFGTSDHVDVPALIRVMQGLIPSAKKVGILFNPNEINASLIKQEMQAELTKLGLRVQEFGILQEKDAAVAAQLAVQQVDVLLTPTDNTIAMAISLIAKIAREHSKPLIVSDNLLVAKGALAARGVDYQASGRQAAWQLLHELHYAMPEENLSASSSAQIYINQAVLKQLKLHLPETWPEPIVLIN